MSSLLHFEVDAPTPWPDARPACGGDFHRRKALTDDPAKVTCRQCRELCGFDEQLVEVEHLEPGRIAA